MGCRASLSPHRNRRTATRTTPRRRRPPHAHEGWQADTEPVAADHLVVANGGGGALDDAAPGRVPVARPVRDLPGRPAAQAGREAGPEAPGRLADLDDGDPVATLTALAGANRLHQWMR